MKIQRLISIITVLLRQNRISANNLAKMFEVSVRTIYRDIEAIETSGIPIVTYKGVNGGIGILESYKIDKSVFTNEDITTILTSLNTLSSSTSNGKLNKTLEKIKSLVPEKNMKSIELTSKQFYIDMTPWADNPKLTGYLDIIRSSIENKNILKINYSGRNNISMERIIEPHQLILKENFWYLKAYCRIRRDFRVFKLSRMINLSTIDETFTIREFSHETVEFKNWNHKKMIIVDILMEASSRESILTYIKEEFIESAENGKLLIHMPFVESDIGYNLLLSLGDKCECISPKHVRDELIRRIDKLRSIYS